MRKSLLKPISQVNKTDKRADWKKASDSIDYMGEGLLKNKTDI